MSKAVSQKETLLCGAWIRVDDLLPSTVAAAAEMAWEPGQSS